MQLADLITPINKMSLSQFETQLKLPPKLPSTWEPPKVEPKPGAKPKRKSGGGRKAKSNNEKQVEDMFKKLSPTQLKALKQILEGQQNK